MDAAAAALIAEAVKQESVAEQEEQQPIQTIVKVTSSEVMNADVDVVNTVEEVAEKVVLEEEEEVGEEEDNEESEEEVKEKGPESTKNEERDKINVSTDQKVGEMFVLLKH